MLKGVDLEGRLEGGESGSLTQGEWEGVPDGWAIGRERAGTKGGEFGAYVGLSVYKHVYSFIHSHLFVSLQKVMSASVIIVLRDALKTVFPVVVRNLSNIII